MLLTMLKNKNRYFWLFLALLTLASVVNIYAQEGSGNWTGATGPGKTNLFVPSFSTGNTGYNTRGFMMLPTTRSGNTAYNNAYDPGHRFYVYVKKEETVYWGFRKATGNDATAQWYYDNRTDDGSITGSLGFYPSGKTGSGRVAYGSNATISTSSGPTQAQSVPGPNITGVRTNGYNANSFTNNTGEDRVFWLEVDGDNLQISFWDVSVYDGTVHKPGRVYSRYWSMVNDLPQNGSSFHQDFKFYVPVDNPIDGGYFIKTIGFGESFAGYAVFFANTTGPRNTGNIQEDRKSRTEVSNLYDFPLFVADPDRSVWNDSRMPVTIVSVDFIRHPTRPTGGALATLKVEADYPGTADIIVEIADNPTEGYTGGKNVVLSRNFSTKIGDKYVEEVEWDGLDADGVIVPNRTDIVFKSSVGFFPVHFPVYDMEQSAGMVFRAVRPGGARPEKIYWDHSGLTGTTSPTTSWTQYSGQALINTAGMDSPDGSNTKWNKWNANSGNNQDNGFGNNRTINTWTGASNFTIVRPIVLSWLEADLEIRKTVNDDEPFVGEVVDFTIVVKNNGISYASNVVMEDELQNNLEYVEHSITPSNKGIATYDNATKKVQWNIGLIEPLDSVIMTLRAKVLAAGTNTATVSNSGVEPDPDPNNNSASVGVAIRNTTVAVDDFVETGQNEPVNGNVLTNDYDPEGDDQTVSNTGEHVTKEGGSITIDGAGNFTYTPPLNFSGIDEFVYEVCDDGSPLACDEAVLSIGVGICTDEVEGQVFEWTYNASGHPSATEGSVVRENFDQPATNYGFVLDIYSLDNSFNMEINGTQLAHIEMQFQGGNAQVPRSIRFKSDGAVWEGGAGAVPNIWTLTGTEDNPIIRVVISPVGSVKIYGSRSSGGPLEELELYNGNYFNTVPWNADGGNGIYATQFVIGQTIMKGKGYGRNITPCLNFWMGGTPGEENTWSVRGNWTDNKVPTVRQDVEFATEDNYGQAATHDLYLDDFDDDGSGGRIIGNLINNSDKNLVITTGNQLTINGKVEEKTDPSSTGTIVVKASPDESSGTLLFIDPSENEKVGAIVEFYNKAYDCEDCGFYTRSWQYFGIPVAESGTTSAPLPFTSVEEVNEWSEPEQSADKWVDPDMPLTAFTGYQITRNEQTEPDQDNAIHNFVGTLNVGDATVTLTKTDNVGYSGVNLVGNSYTAAIPINTTALDFQPAVQQTVYLFNTGTRDQWRKLNGSSVSGLNAGRYLSVPVNLAGVEELPGMIPSMHAFMLLTEQTAYLTIRYNQLVRNELVEDVNGNMISTRSAGATGTTGKATAASTIPSLKMDVIGEQSADRVWIFTKEGTTYGFDNGWDGRKMAESGITQLYVMDDAEKDRFQVATVPGLDNVTLGFVADTDGKYTVEFALSDHWTTEEIYLNDLATGTQTRVVNGGSYSFEAKKGDSGLRFHFSSSGNIPVDGEAARITVISTDDGNIAINNKSDNDCTVFISNTAGILLQKLEVEAGGEQVVEDVSGGTYVVRLQNAVVNDARRIVVR